MQILGLLGMYFDAVVVTVITFLLLFRLALAILCKYESKELTISGPPLQCLHRLYPEGQPRFQKSTLFPCPKRASKMSGILNKK